MRVAIASLAALALVFACGCGDDGATETTDTATVDTSVATDTGADDTVTADTTVEDTAVADAVDDTTAVDTTPVDPNDPCNYVFSDKVAYITELAIASQSDTESNGQPDDHCCFDQDSNGSVDNRLGEIVKAVQELPQITRNVNDVLAANIADGTIAILAENVGLDSLVSSTDATVNFFYGLDTDADQANNLSGEGTFYVKPSSFTDGTAAPRVSFSGVTVTNGNLFVGPGVFHLDIPLVNGLAIEADIQNTRIEGKISEGPHGGVAIDGVDSHGGKLGGIVRQDDLFGAFNTFVDGYCSCLQVQGGDAALVKSGETWGCATFDKSACDEGDEVENQCRVLADACGLALALITPDIDTDNSGVADAFSVGFWFRATGASVVGVDPAACGD